MGAGSLFPWARRSSGSSKHPKSNKRAKKTKNVEHERITTKERQTNSSFQGLVMGLWAVGRCISRAKYLILGALFLFAFIPDPRAGGHSFLGTVNTVANSQAGWPAVLLRAMDAVPAIVNWWSADSKNRTTSTIPQARFISPISAEEAFVIPEYLTTLKLSIAGLNVMDGSFRLSQAMEDSFGRAMKEAELFKEIHDGWMTGVKLRFARHYDQLGQLQIDIERAIIDIADREETKKSSFWGFFTRDKPYARARNHHKILKSITKDMFTAIKSESDRLIELLEELRVFETDEEYHGAICGLRSQTIGSVQTWTKDTKDIRAEVKVMCNSSKRSKVKLGMAKNALQVHLASIDTVHKGLLTLQHDQAKTLEMALLGYCKSLLEAMQRLAEFGNG